MRMFAVTLLLCAIERSFAVDVSTTTTGCVDVSDECTVKNELCDINEYDGLMNYYCKETCARSCALFTTTTTIKPCADVTPDCVAKAELCEMDEFKALTSEYCRKTCGLC